MILTTLSCASVYCDKYKAKPLSVFQNISDVITLCTCIRKIHDGKFTFQTYREMGDNIGDSSVMKQGFKRLQ